MLNLPTVKLSTGLAQICNKVLWSTNEKFMCELKKATVPTLTGTTDVDNLIRHFSLRI